MKIKKLAAYLTCFIGAVLMLPSDQSTASVNAFSDAGFESGSFTGWNKGSQSGSLSNGVISGGGTGVTLINTPVTFNAPSNSAVGNPTLPNGSPNPYYAPAVIPTTWIFSPYGTYAAALQPAGGATFDQATSAIGLSSVQNQAIKSLLIQQQQASGLGNPNPTDAAWITKEVTLTAGITYTMSWNYIGTDYVPFNDGSITSLVFQGTGSTPTITVNNNASNYAILGFTNPGTGDYSTGTYGSTGWQVSTYQVSVTGNYLLGFAVFNLGDTSLSPVLLVDSQPGATTKNGQQFGAVAPNNPNAPTVPPSQPSTTTEPTTTTTEPATTTTEPETTTTEVITTTVPVITEPIVESTVVETTQPIVENLPITGNNLSIYRLAGFLFIFGSIIFIMNRWLVG